MRNRVGLAAKSSGQGGMLVRRILVFEDSVREELKSRLRHVRFSDDGWSTILRDPRTGDEWVETHLYGEYHGGGWLYLSRLPHPRQDELVELAVASRFHDEAELAARLISGNADARRQLLRRLQEEGTRAADPAWARIRDVVRWAGLENSTNLLPTIGKTLTEIRADHKAFEELAREALELRLQADAALG